MNKSYDFRGWATKNDLLCSDGRTIRRGAFSHQDGERVPLMWNHMHSNPDNILGYAILHNADAGVLVDGYFNDTEHGRNARECLRHGDIRALSICAAQVKQDSHKNVLHGNIKEVSLVVSPANPGAWIDTIISHGDYEDETFILYTGEPLELEHAEEDSEDPDDSEGFEDGEVYGNDEDDDLEHADEDDKEDKEEGGKTIKEIIGTLNDEQKQAVYAVVGDLKTQLDDAKKNTKEDKEEMKHNVFEGTAADANSVFTHSDEVNVVNIAKECGSFQKALEYYLDENDIEFNHGDIAPSGGFVQPPTAGNVTQLFPEYKDVRTGAPEIIRNDNEWVSKVLNKVHKSPISRIRTSLVDIREYEENLRAKGYQKGTKKALTGNIALLRRTIDPQTVYVKNALHRDDIIDITDFDYVDYMYKIDRSMLELELARAILIGDGRDDSAEDKISESHIKSIWNDNELYTLHVDLDIEAARSELQGTETGSYFGDNYVTAEAMITAVLYAREKYKGTGSPDMFITPHMLNVMLLAKDRNGRRIFNGVGELTTAFNVNSIITVEQFADKTRTAIVDGVEKTKKLIALICNLSDYTLGSTKGGQITHFTQFDIDFNQEKSLLETRSSGALTRVYSAIAVEEEVNF